MLIHVFTRTDLRSLRLTSLQLNSSRAVRNTVSPDSTCIAVIILKLYQYGFTKQRMKYEWKADLLWISTVGSDQYVWLLCKAHFPKNWKVVICNVFLSFFNKFTNLPKYGIDRNSA